MRRSERGGGEEMRVDIFGARNYKNVFAGGVYLSVSTTYFTRSKSTAIKSQSSQFRVFLSESITMTRQNLHEKIHQQYFTPTALSFFHLLPLSSLARQLTALCMTTKIIHISLSFMIRIVNCLCLLPFINIKGKEWPRSGDKKLWGTGKREDLGDGVLCMWCLRCFIYEFHQHGRAQPAVKYNPKTCEIKVLVRFSLSPSGSSCCFVLSFFGCVFRKTWNIFQASLCDGKKWGSEDMSEIINNWGNEHDFGAAVHRFSTLVCDQVANLCEFSQNLMNLRGGVLKFRAGSLKSHQNKL